MEWIAIVTPTAIWANAVWASPYLKTYRHRMSFFLSVIADLLLFGLAKMQPSPSADVIFWSFCAVLAAMLASLVWPPAKATNKHKSRRKRYGG